MKSFLKYWLPVLIWLGIIFVGSTNVLSAEQTSRFLVPFLRWLRPEISDDTLAQIHLFVRKLGHVSEYAIFAMLLWRALRSGANLRMKMSILFFSAWIVCALFAASDEFHQSFVPSRTPSLRDAIIDICGATIGLAICLIIPRRHSSAVRKTLP
jgi:VanZ family protein